MPEARRYHSLDALRGAMMLLGLVLHSAASYTYNNLGEAWPYQDARTSIAFDLLLFFIHVFRMPVFFVVAGFFAAFLYRRDGARGFARNRVRRVLLPLLIFWPTVLPVAAVGIAFTLRSAGIQPPPLISTDPIWRQPILGHLWFLYDLIIFYAAALIVLPAAGRLPAGVAGAARAFVRASVASAWGVLLPSLLTAATLLPMTIPVIEGSASPLPRLRGLVAYGVFFGFGWLLHAERDLLQGFGQRAKPYAAAAVIATVVYLAALNVGGVHPPAGWHGAGALAGGLATWLLCFAAIGLVVRYLDAHRPLVRYLSDASYWMYLVHILPAVWVPGVLARSAMPAGVKFAIVLATTTVVTLVTYHYLVRPTAIGELLNGRRHTRRMAERKEAV